MRLKFYTIGMVCMVARMVLMPFFCIAMALRWKVLMCLILALMIGTIVYEVVKIRCPYCGRCLAFAQGRGWDGRCPDCGIEIT